MEGENAELKQTGIDKRFGSASGIQAHHSRATFMFVNNMSDIKDALSVLCKYFNSLINVDLTSEHLRLAKSNVPDEHVVSVWIRYQIRVTYVTLI